MIPIHDHLYRIHQFQAARRGRPPLEYNDFLIRAIGQSETDLSQLFLPESRVGLEPLFNMGVRYVSTSVIAKVDWFDVHWALAAHGRGKWGEVSPKQWLANDLAVASGGRICSAHRNLF